MGSWGQPGPDASRAFGAKGEEDTTSKGKTYKGRD